MVVLLAGSPALAHGDKPHAEVPAGHGAAVGTPGDPRKAVRTVRVEMGDDMTFRPAVITVRVGQTITFVVRNAGTLKHELVLGTQAELEAHAKEMEKNPDMEHDDPNAAHVDPGKTGTLTWRFTTAGDVPFACLIPGHMQGGMVGRVIVKP